MIIATGILGRLADFIGLAYEPGLMISAAVTAILAATTFYHPIYCIIGFFTTRKFPKAKNNHKYAILIPARNESAVIGNLLNSIKRQDYPAELLTVFVVADNCTDNTAEIARQNGAVCYERFDDSKRTKGYALEFLFENIEKDYGIKSFEGFFVFDSDNLLNRDYVTRMNEAFDAGEKIITSYRNTKNFDENWVAASYALHWLRSIRYRHRARSVLRLATNIQGTGFLFANELVENGWHYVSLTEDRAFTADAVAHGYKITYNDDAMFFDEQPVSLRIALRQRVRWAKGHLQAFAETGLPLFKNIFVGNCYRKKEKNEKLTKERIIEGIRHRFASFDTLEQLIPKSVIRLGMWLLFTIIIGGFYIFGHGAGDVLLFSGNGWLVKTIRYIFGETRVSYEPGFKAVVNMTGMLILCRLLDKIAFDISEMLIGVYIFFIERKRIIKISLPRKILYCITWPSFDIIGRYAMYAALFMNVTWKPIPHNSSVTIEDIEDGGADN